MEHLSTVTRRLAAVAFADVVDWSRLVEHDDLGTLRAWRALRADLIEPKFREHGGRLQETSGDAVLVEFPSAVEAVTWALETQRGLSQNQAADGSPRLRLRIAINIEDVIVDEETIIGDGINIAARILPLAEPGGIVVTSTVRDYVWNKMPVSFDDMGERELKNISRPIRVYRVDAPQTATRIPVPRQPHLSWAKRPAIAVLPFRNLGGDPDETYFSEGITEDIIGGLSRSRAVYVIAWNSTLRYRDQQKHPQDIASELGVRYILNGSVRRRASRLRISSELIDATNSRALWAEKFDGADSEIFEFQDRIATSIVGTIEPRLYQAESARILTKPTESLDAYDNVLRALSLLYTLDDRQFAEAGECLQRAVALDPSYAQAHAYLGWWLNLKRGEGRSIDRAGDAEKAIAAAMRAMELDAHDAFCLAVAGHIQGFLNKSLDVAVELFDQALHLNENSAFAWGISASTYCFLGQPDEALERLRNAWRLSPYDPLNFWFCTVAGLAEFVAGRYDQAIGWLRKAQRLNHRFSACNRTLAASLALAGEIQAAQTAAQQVLSVEPTFRISIFTSWYPLRRQEDLKRLAEGLRLAQLPD
ncbi:adenylate cyclase [Vineibacter terrae]|uniref:Adenylate cyclase n=1 Tax=Vineibacter terrae TaxID=2586908 RepID=A0A5C8PSQ9_9HYPH|nr:adenylate/guanylate cyclase domain-containing protein [Vineibacter terrae]TXL80314.1 adenylate cyclase [Vineibacter terrae]